MKQILGGLRKVSIGLLLVASAVVYSAPAQAQSTSERLAGQIVIQVEENGEAWYIDPDDNTRYFMGRPQDAFDLMRTQGKGIASAPLWGMPIGLIAQSGSDIDADGLVDLLEDAIGTNKNSKDTDGDGFNDRDEVNNWFNPNGPEALSVNDGLIDRFIGDILLQVEDHGESWYVNPENRKRYFLGRPSHAFQIMRDLGLGITNSDLATISVNSNSAPVPQAAAPTQPAPEPDSQPVLGQLLLEADDSGFYINGDPETIILSDLGSDLSITFAVRSDDVYFGGLDFRGCGFETGKVLPGETSQPQIVVLNESCEINSYWPDTNDLKATLKLQINQN